MRRTSLLAGPLVAALSLALLPPVSQAAPRGSISVASVMAFGAGTSRATLLRVAMFNVSTARTRSNRRNWLRRAPHVACEIPSRNPGLVALQELGPGRADGRKGTLRGHLRQTTSLTNALRRHGGGEPPHQLGLPDLQSVADQTSSLYWRIGAAPGRGAGQGWPGRPPLREHDAARRPIAAVGSQHGGRRRRALSDRSVLDVRVPPTSAARASDPEEVRRSQLL